MDTIPCDDILSTLKLPPLGLDTTNTANAETSDLSNHINISNNTLNVPIPPMIPLSWQLTLPSEELGELSESVPLQFIPHSSTVYSHSPKLLTVQNQTRSISAPTISHTQITQTLTHFASFHTYTNTVETVINGYTRDMQCQLSNYTIPKDINALIFSFYYQKCDKYIHFGYKLSQIPKIKTTETGTFSGQCLVDAINDNELYKPISSVPEICNQLCVFGILELVSYKTSFLALFGHETSEETETFVCSKDYLYGFKRNIRDALAEFDRNSNEA